MKYEYAGFMYDITGEGSAVAAIPLPGQHPAANKEKHRMAAIECWLDDKSVNKDHANE